MVTGVDAVGNASSAVREVKIGKPLSPYLDGDGFRDDQDCVDLNP